MNRTRTLTIALLVLLALLALSGARPFQRGTWLMVGGAYSYARGRRMLAFVIVCIVLAISARYELIEWVAALLCLSGWHDRQIHRLEGHESALASL
jgi:uncharacterized membrane protein YjdF